MPRSSRSARAATIGALVSAVLVVGFELPSRAAAAVPVSGPPWGSLAPVSVRFGVARVSGFALDPDTVAPIRVTVAMDGRIVRTVTAGRAVAWVGRTYPYYGPRHGYLTGVAVPDGQHRLCVTLRNVEAGHDTTLPCRTVLGHNDPVGRWQSVVHTGTGIVAQGWALDPDTTAAVQIATTVDGIASTTVSASLPITLPSGWASYGRGHGFTATLPADPAGHVVCLTARNRGAGHATSLGCRSVPAHLSAPSAPQTLTTTSTTSSITVHWSAPATDGGTPVTGYQVRIDGAAPQAVAATTTTLTGTGLSPATTHSITVAAVNAVGPGVVSTIRATTLAGAPGAPTSVTATTTATTITLHWGAPATTGGIPVTQYQLTVAGVTRTLTATTTGDSVTGLTPATVYVASLRAVNAVGPGPAAAISVTTAAALPAIPPQTTPAPVSTSHYLRNLTGVASHDIALMRSMGSTDAGYNPSGHRYLVLLDIGAQSGSGVLLSATTRWISYAALVTAVQAYVDGYASTQKANAPLLLAIGTNSDGAVSSTTGGAWATSVINPVAAYASTRPGITVAGADDMEPGFSATATQSRSWLSGYLAATTTQFVFNGSADGCPTSSGSTCNNGWSTTDLHWLSGTAAPARILVLPQIYNSAMPLQWHLISAQGTQRLDFAGPLTEWTACYQDNGSCYSTTNVTAWTLLFGALNSDPRTAIAAMPYGTDLQIN